MIRRLLLWWYARQIAVSEFHFPEALRRAQRILIVIPGGQAFRQVGFFLSRMARIYPKAQITLLYPPHSIAASFYNPFGFRIIVPEKPNVTFLGTPKRAFLYKLFAEEYDLIISLDKQVHQFLAAVLAQSNVPVRLGLPGGLGAPFTTVELRHGRTEPDVKAEFILYVEMIRKLVVRSSPANG